MASAQCCKPEEKTSCHQQSSFGQKVSDMTSSIFKGHGSNGQTTEYYSQTETYYTDHGVEKTQTNYCHSETQGRRPHHTLSKTSQSQCITQTDGHHASGATACQVKTKRRGEVKKRGLLQRIKDGLSGDSSSSSDSESDDEKCGTRKN